MDSSGQPYGYGQRDAEGWAVLCPACAYGWVVPRDRSANGDWLRCVSCGTPGRIVGHARAGMAPLPARPDPPAPRRRYGGA